MSRVVGLIDEKTGEVRTSPGLGFLNPYAPGGPLSREVSRKRGNPTGLARAVYEIGMEKINAPSRQESR